MKVKAIGITGASGIIGSKICQNLLEKGYILHVLTRNPENFKKNPRKGQYAYLLTPKGIREKSILTHNFIERKRQEYNDLEREIEALEEEAGLISNFDQKK